MITLDTMQQETFEKLVGKCKQIESDLKTSVTSNEPTEIQNQIEQLRPYLSDVSTMLSDVTSLYDFAQEQCAEKMLSNGSILNAKSNIQKMWISGQIKEYNQLFVRVESVTKKLDKSIDTLVSLLSFEKEKIKHNIHQQ